MDFGFYFARLQLIIPHLLRYKGSAFVLDPKGENYTPRDTCNNHFGDLAKLITAF